MTCEEGECQRGGWWDFFFLIFYLFIILGLHQVLGAAGEPLVMAGGVLFPRQGSRPALRAGSVESQPWAGRAVPGVSLEQAAV